MYGRYHMHSTVCQKYQALEKTVNNSWAIEWLQCKTMQHVCFFSHFWATVNVQLLNSRNRGRRRESSFPPPFSEGLDDSSAANYVNLGSTCKFVQLDWTLQLDNTSSHPGTEVKPCWARLVHGWETVRVSSEYFRHPEGTYGDRLINSWPHRFSKMSSWLL